MTTMLLVCYLLGVPVMFVKAARFAYTGLDTSTDQIEVMFCTVLAVITGAVAAFLWPVVTVVLLIRGWLFPTPIRERQ